MAKQRKNGISPSRKENYPEWYQQVIREGELAENSPVRGCMVIKPWGYSLWENIQKFLDQKFKETGHTNAYFPLFIPKSFLEKEAQHVKGFAKECAVVTHHRLESGPNGTLVPSGELDEPLIVRPTSETIIGASYSKWVQSYRDLPILVNQWSNVVRWEMRTRLFLRTTEFLWQEGHTVHETEQEAIDETHMIINLYKDFVEEYMAMPIIVGEKSDAEKFPGAVKTLCIEALMQDGKALQAGTSHFLGQNFSKSSEIKFQNRDGENEYAWTTSWGVSTRLIGGMIMTHADDDGMIMPPRLSPQHIVIIPHIRDEQNQDIIISYCENLIKDLSKLNYKDRKLEIILDQRDLKIGEKTWNWIKKGIPIRFEIGMREIRDNTIFISRRDNGDKSSIGYQEALDSILDILDNIQSSMYNKAYKFRDNHSVEIDNYEDFKNFFTTKRKDHSEITGGFAWAHFCGDLDWEKRINEDLGVTLRLIPFNTNPCNNEKCIFSGKKSVGRVLFSKSY